MTAKPQSTFIRISICSFLFHIKTRVRVSARTSQFLFKQARYCYAFTVEKINRLWQLEKKLSARAALCLDRAINVVVIDPL